MCLTRWVSELSAHRRRQIVVLARIEKELTGLAADVDIDEITRHRLYKMAKECNDIRSMWRKESVS